MTKGGKSIIAAYLKRQNLVVNARGAHVILICKITLCTYANIGRI